MKRMLKRGKDIERLLAIVEMLATDQILLPANRDHVLSRKYTGL